MIDVRPTTPEIPTCATVHALIIPRPFRILNVAHIQSTCRLKSVLRLSSGLDLDAGRAGGLVALGGDDHVVEGGTEGHAGVLPGGEEVLGGDGAADALALADGPELLEGLGAVDGRGVGTGALVQLVDGTVGGDLALEGTSATGVVLAVVLDDIVLDEL